MFDGIPEEVRRFDRLIAEREATIRHARSTIRQAERDIDEALVQRQHARNAQYIGVSALHAVNWSYHDTYR